MHPMVAYLALHGYVLVAHIDTLDRKVGVGDYRVKRQQKDGERMLMWEINNQEWVAHGAASVTHYRVVDWECLSCELWDMLTQKNVNDFIESDFSRRL